MGLGLAFSTLTNSLSDLKEPESTHLSLFSQTLVEESLIQTLALTEENRFGWNLVLKGHSMVHRERHGFHNWSPNPCFHLFSVFEGVPTPH